jgi:hypothetical protein
MVPREQWLKFGKLIKGPWSLVKKEDGITGARFAVVKWALGDVGIAEPAPRWRFVIHDDLRCRWVSTVH